MRALVWHGKEDIRCDTVSDPQIEDSRDAIIKVTSCAICGSDLHLFNNYMPVMLPGDIMGHETMGEVVEVGGGVNGKLKKGDRIVVSHSGRLGKKFPLGSSERSAGYLLRVNLGP
jgi:threonine dehydrogenase-like Zn-dependent dehydrogenase